MLRSRTAIAVIVAATIAFPMPSAFAQSFRVTEIIERSLAAQPNLVHGRKLYQDNCANCHGQRAHGTSNPVTPALAGQLPVYLIKQLVDFSEAQRSAPAMHSVVALKELTSPQSLCDISNFLARLPINSQPERGDGSELAAGRRFYEGLCAYCHGARGEGNEDHATPALRGQHYSYLLMQTRRLSNSHRDNVPFEVMDVLDGLTFDAMTQIADYASRLSLEPPKKTAEVWSHKSNSRVQ